MTTTSAAPHFKGTYKDLLTEMAEFIDGLWQEHGTSFVKAGDDRVYAFGGKGYVLVLDESKWDGLVELITPKGALSIKPGDDGQYQVSSTIADEKTIKQILRDGIDGLKSYYDNRYWSTPSPS
ncbi:MAG TPA: hypothetical protein VE262_09085 [Blastocatellia bacterium]|nr:hypothetical protein [Blastocatellia bacterium]